MTWTIKVPENQDHSLKCYKNCLAVTSFIGRPRFLSKSYKQQPFYPGVSFTDFSVIYENTCSLLPGVWYTPITMHSSNSERQPQHSLQEQCRRRLTTSSWVAALSWFCSSEPTYGSCSRSESGGTWHLCPGKQSYITMLQLLGLLNVEFRGVSVKQITHSYR